MEEKEIIQNRITNLINLRQTMIQALIILIGGTIGVCFTSNSASKYVLIILGILCGLGIMQKLHNYHIELKGYLYEKQRR